MQEGRIEIKTRPSKIGWLEEQVNSVFDIWQSKYCILDGTQLLVFDDDQRQQPTASINLHRCIVDGIWKQGDLHIFTIRSLNQEMEESFIKLGAHSMQEVLEWKEIIKNSIILLEYETLFKALEAEEQFDKVIQESDYSISDMDSIDFQEHPESQIGPQIQLANIYASQNISNEFHKIQSEIESKFEDNQNQWTLFQVESQLRIYKQVHKKDNLVYYRMHGHLESIDFDTICTIFSDPMNDQFWDFYLEEKELYLKVNENYSVYKTKEIFYQNKHSYHFKNVYREMSWFDTVQKNRVFYSYRQRIQEEQSQNIDIKYKPLKFQQQIIRLEKMQKGYIKMKVFLSVPHNQIQHNSIIETYLMERLINFSIFKFEYDEVIEKVQQRQRRIQGDLQSYKANTHQQIKSFQVLDAIDNQNDTDEDIKVQSQNISVMSNKISSQMKNNPSWNEDIHLRVKKLDAQQLEIFQKFKQNYNSLNLTDNQYIQFLIARKFNEQDTKQMIDNWAQWKIQTNFDNLTINDFPHLHQLKAYRSIGKDSAGRPIGLGISRYIFPEKLPCDYAEYCLYYCVYLNHMKKLGEGYVDQIIMINDVGGLNKSNVDLSLTRKQLSLFLDYFPEAVYKLVAVNADFFTRMIWKAIKPFVGKSTRDKIIIVGSDQEEIHNTLLEYMDDDVIPQLYGGKNSMFNSY